MNVLSGLGGGRVVASILIIFAAVFSIPAFSQQPSTDGQRPEFIPESPAREPVGSATSTFADGASRILELHGEWTVLCRIADTGKVCDVVQARQERRTGRRVLTIYVRAVAAGRVRVILILPAALRRGTTVSVDLDSKPLGQKQYISACTEQSCIVSYAFDAIAFAALRNGRQLTVNIIDTVVGASVSLVAPLVGFSSAVQRSADLLYGELRPRSSGGFQ